MIVVVKEMKRLHLWFKENQRDFPWRKEKSPYRVWVSEVMLQQTRASVVVPYFNRWMDAFPTVERLAAASLEQVIKMWEGLGYYSRARRLHQGAQEICSRFGGQIPSSAEELASIPGLGPYTIGAILSFGFQKRALAIDGNVARVASRFSLVEENIDRARGRRLLEAKVDRLLDPEEPWVSAEALIELGATLCLPTPRCESCPLSTGCLGLQAKKQEALPIKNSPPEMIALSRKVVILESKGSVLVKKEKEGRLMANLYEFPYFEMKGGIWSSSYLIRKVKDAFQCRAEFICNLQEIQQSFTRYKARLYPTWLRIPEACSNIEGWQWIAVEKLSELPFSSGHRKIVEQMMALQEVL
jgi:A/G-specific adenine glycosylase